MKKTEQYVGNVGSGGITSHAEPDGRVSSEIRKLCYTHDGVMKFESHLKCDQIQEYVNILEITPKDQDPVMYWHQVAMDAIKAQESAQNRAKQANEERDRTERELNNLLSGLTAKVADKRAAIPLDMSRLIDMAAAGGIDLSVDIHITHGKGTYGNEYEAE